VNKIAAALVKAQREFGPALKDKTNPAFRSKYADLGACIEAVIDALNMAGIALIQKQHPHEGGVTVETIFLHESGEQFSAGMLSVPAAKQDPQGYGSALTYARRYSLMAACGIAPEDDDGNAGSKAFTKPVSKPVEPPKPVIGMSPNSFADWKAAIETAGPDELAVIANEAREAAKAANDKEAFDALRSAVAKRRTTLEAAT
jgi:ERF superfamily